MKPWTKTKDEALDASAKRGIANIERQIRRNNRMIAICLWGSIAMLALAAVARLWW
jgi:hypothetical protein